MLAPICLFTYNRLFETRQTILALQKNFLAPESDLIIFSDGGKNDASWKQVYAVRDYVKNSEGFKSLRIIESEFNKGLANSIIQGVSLIMAEYGKAIVMEDDLVTSTNFLDYMNQCLDQYNHNPKVFAISGYSYPLKYSKDYIYDVAFGYRSYSWGWASWKDRWDKVDWEVSDYTNFLKSKSLQKSFNRGGSDLSAMLKKQMSGKLDSWMIRWVYHQFRNDMYDVFPTISKVLNNGFTKTATHTSSCSPLRYLTPLDKSQSRFFSFPMHVSINEVIIKQVQSKISLTRRIKFRLFDILKISKFLIENKLIKLDKINNDPILSISLSDKKVPVLLVIFNRPETTDKVFAAIKQYKPEKLYIASDGPRENKTNEEEIVISTRKIITENIDWPCEVKTLFREKNIGCGYGVSTAISWFLEQEEYGIILEDDCYPSPSFFPYCEELLLKYKDDDRIKMIGGNNFQKGNKRGDASYFFAHYPTVWVLPESFMTVRMISFHGLLDQGSRRIFWLKKFWLKPE